MSRMGQGFRLVSSWIAVPFTSAGRRGFAWYVAKDIPTTVTASGALPQTSWSQDGEDLLLAEQLPTTGRYVDVGAHHPDHYSVTRKLYDRGWSGVNIDFSPDFQRTFDTRRPRDTNVTALVGTPRDGQFWRFEEGTLSTLDEGRARQLVDLGWPLSRVDPVSVRSLTEILDSVAFEGGIDLLSVDVEGEDLAVLQSLDWIRWPVERCLVEIVLPAFDVPSHPVAQYLESQGLRLTRVWGRSCLFERNFVPDELER